MTPEPTTAEILQKALQMALVAHRAGKLEDAAALYRSILEVQPQHSDANHNLGVLAVSLNQAEAALPFFKTALKANPSQGQFWLSYIDALIKTNQIESAKSVLDQGKKAGLAGEAVNVLEMQLKPLTLNQEAAPLFQKQGLTSAQQLKMALAKKDKQKKSPSKQPNSTSRPSQADLETLLRHYQTGQYALAETLAKTITQKYPDHPFAWKALGAVYKRASRLPEAVIANQKAVELDPTDADAHYNLGNSLDELGRLEDAETSYREAIALQPDYAEAHSNLGNTLKELGRLEDAETNLRKALALKPDFAEAHSNLGNTLKELGRLEDAETNLRKALALKPDFAEAHNNLGATLKELGRLEEAQGSYDQALALKPDFKKANNGLGHIFLKKNCHKDGLDRIRLGSGSICFDVISGLTIK
jgi:tetratricopeptide (TPR) repeat protein